MKSVAIVIPMHNEAEAAEPLIQGIVAACSVLPEFEIIAVDDGSTDDTAARIEALQARIPQLRLLRHPHSGGQSAAVHSGVCAARSPICCTLDGDGQNPPEELPKLWTPLLNDTSGRIGLVAGQRVGRRDDLSKRLASRIANALRGWILKDGTRDTGCGLKGFRRDMFLGFPYFDHMHRYLPALARRDGWEIVLVDVTHRERQTGQSNYSNLQRAVVGVRDLIGVAWLIARRKKVRALEEGARPSPGKGGR
ncbi:dolichol-phosphate mannosyltransferase [Defluviimonas sp. 20V17]|uniref:Dolichol-phosphate mannosyltransferase n=1 Tax=Allgaiera indica TaxID=765699 RepID=A0AAN4US28_9RHOB|nr:glycosyltransferase family 2 protein [Allgaiera indica]KDB02266.1 dolichol-phosphate mannosyltransferase [Defluviimonas sp. 20V17]GHE02864.1 dolichol-phosphate mannosyltransferase [Allgaiera indica]SDX16642.1 Glycosyltransferase involved in cell wall bisynthesis [Allgaiera indica]